MAGLSTDVQDITFQALQLFRAASPANIHDELDDPTDHDLVSDVRAFIRDWHVRHGLNPRSRQRQQQLQDVARRKVRQHADLVIRTASAADHYETARGQEFARQQAASREKADSRAKFDRQLQVERAQKAAADRVSIFRQQAAQAKRYAQQEQLDKDKDAKVKRQALREERPASPLSVLNPPPPLRRQARFANKKAQADFHAHLERQEDLELTEALVCSTQLARLKAFVGTPAELDAQQPDT